MSIFEWGLALALLVAAWVCVSWGASGLVLFAAGLRHRGDDAHAGVGGLRLTLWVGSAVLGAAGALLAAALLALR